MAAERSFMGHWTQVDIITSTQGIEVVSAMLASLDLGSIAIQDAEDFKEFLKGKDVYWDYIEDELMELTHAPTVITVYLSQWEQGEEQLAQLPLRLQELKSMDTENAWGPLTFTTQAVKEEDWATNWKQYYHPVPIGERLLICPTWETCDDTQRTLVRMDPGMAFGTGTHESTKLCLEELDTISTGGERVLDIGTGSGILGISALLLGGDFAEGVDIDQVAVKVAQENARVNGVEDRAVFRKGSFTQFASGQYQIIFANIVADAIMSLAPDVAPLLAPGGQFIASGVIDTRADEVEKHLQAAGLVVIARREDNGWVVFRCTAETKEGE